MIILNYNWKDIPGYEGLYKVNHEGNVLSCKFDRLLKAGLDKDGYKITYLSNKNVRKFHRVHRLVASTFVPNPLNHPIVDHIDGCRTNNQSSNLRWCTNIENLNFPNRKLTKNINAKSGYKGVYWHNIKKKYMAISYLKGVRKHMGYGRTPIEAYNKLISI